MKSADYKLSISSCEYGTSFILIGENGEQKTLICEGDFNDFLDKLSVELGGREEIERSFNWLDDLEKRFTTSQDNKQL